MPKKSDEIVSDDADINRRFETLEKRAENSEGLLTKIAEKLGIGKVDDTPKPNSGDNPSEPPKPKAKNVLVELGILSGE